MDNLKVNLVASIACAALTLFAAPAAPAGHRPQTVKNPTPHASVAPVKRGDAGNRAVRKPVRRGPGARVRDEHMSREDRRLVDALEDVRGFGELAHLYPVACRAPNPYVRAALVDALEEQGERSVNLLAGLIADPDEDVANAAFAAWTSIVDDMRHRHRPTAILEAAEALKRMVTPVPAPVVAAPVAAQPVVVTQPVQ